MFLKQLIMFSTTLAEKTKMEKIECRASLRPNTRAPSVRGDGVCYVLANVSPGKVFVIMLEWTIKGSSSFGTVLAFETLLGKST